jgi:energy-coupling factor transport system ATP-binding protein
MISIKDLSFRYYISDTEKQYGVGNAQVQYIFKNFNLQIEENERVFVRAGTGMGKTTLFRIISGLIPTFYKGELSGDVSVFGESSPENFRKHVFFVSQYPDEQIIFDDVYDEISSVLRIHGLNEAEIEDIVFSNARKMNIEHLLERKTGELSDGEKQAIILLTSICSLKDSIIFDEPLSHLHPKRAVKIVDFILKQEKTILLSDHRLEFDREFDRVINLHRDFMDPRDVRETDCTEEVEDERAFADTDHVFSTYFKESEPKSSSAKVELKDVVFSYDSNKTLIDGIDLSVSKGEIISVIGDNGSGKTTLLKLISGLLKPDSGKITREKRLKITLSTQYPNYHFTERTVKKELSGVPLSAMKNFQLQHIIHRHPHSLSGGESKLVSISKAFSGDLLLLDEPMVGQEPSFRKKLISTIKKTGKTAIITTHDLKLAYLCDRCYELRNGNLRSV